MSDSLHPSWLGALTSPSTYAHPSSHIHVVETHISWVVLTGEWAYKLKKPVNFGFVDFTTLELRHAACLDEVRLNQRTAPELYDSVVPLTLEEDGTRFGGKGRILEYAVRMRQFDSNDAFDRRQARHLLTQGDIESLARRVAELHRIAAIDSDQTSFGNPASIRTQVQDCLDELAKSVSTVATQRQLHELQQWVIDEWTRLKDAFAARKQEGFVRECHGDLHLGNVVLYAGRPTLFDCLEFNPRLRWIDILSDIAFLVMDLHDHGVPRLAWSALNEWLEQTGDYGGLPLLPYYLTYRALVRSKVAALRGRQPDLSDSETQEQQQLLQSYLNLASGLTQSNQPAVLLMHGLSGSGKSFVARYLARTIGAVQIRSDVERKRLFGLWPEAESPAQNPPEIYTPAATEQTYRRLQALTEHAIEAGYTVIVDAAFLKQSQREQFASLAINRKIPWVIIDCQAPEPVLRDRITHRIQSGKDASDADTTVLELQLRSAEPISDSEAIHRITINTASTDAARALDGIWDQLTHIHFQPHHAKPSTGQ